MHTSLNNNISNPQMCSSLLSNYYDNSFHFETPQEHYHTPSSFLVPSPIYIPLEDEAVFCEFFQQDLLFFNDHNQTTHEMTTNSIGECSNNNGKNVTNHGDDDHGDVEPYKDTLKKRPTNRDRHSKINTARGLRDRRIRLSLDVAKMLFGLQDMLGFDKASKTIDWLLTKSNTAILDLFHRCSFMGESNNASSTSECEVVSRTTNQLMVETGDDQVTTKTKALRSSFGSNIKQKGKTIGVRKCDPLAKETRVKARQRARKRTVEKQNKYKDIAVGVDDQDSTFSQGFDQVMDLDVNAQGSWSFFEDNQHLIMDQMNASFQFCQGFVDDNSPLWMTN